MSTSLTPTLRILLSRGDLTADETRAAFSAMMSGEVSHAEMGALLGMLALRVPTPEELLGAAQVMREHVARVPAASDPETLVDTCGTGGAPKTFNVSTAAAIVAAACGVKVAKHGNRSRTGRGSAEVLKALGVNVDADLETEARCIDQAGLCFCFAIHHHPATKHVMPVRLALGVPTIFNLLGPLTNPAGAKRQVLGVYDQRFLEPMALALRALGTTRAMVVHSQDGLDELSISAPTEIVHVVQGELHVEKITPEDVGLARSPIEQVMAKDLTHATQLVRDILSRKEQGAPRDMTLLNAAAALRVAEKAADWRQAIDLARGALDSGQAEAKLEALITTSNP